MERVSVVVRDAMQSQPVRIRIDASISHAAEVVALSQVSDLMVLDADGTFVGILSEGDILRSAMPDRKEIVEEGGTLQDAFGIFLDRGGRLSSVPIDPLVIRDPICVDPEDHVAQAATVMVDRNIRVLPVVRDGLLLGSISRADICRAIAGTHAPVPQAPVPAS